MFKILCLSLLLVSQSSAGFSDYLPWRLGTTLAQKKQPDLKGLLSVVDALDSTQKQQKQVTTSLNTSELQDLRRQINEIDRQLKDLSQKIDLRLDEIRRDYIGLRDDLKKRKDKRAADIKTAQIRLKRQKSIIDFVSSWSKRYGNFARNLIDIKNKLLGDYDEDLLKQYKATEQALVKVNAQLLANWKNEITDPQIYDYTSKIQELLLQRGGLLTRLQDQLRTTSKTVGDNPLDGLSKAIKAANCPYIKSAGATTEPNLVQCFVATLKDKRLDEKESCASVLIPGNRSDHQRINPSLPLKDYVMCARDVVSGKDQRFTKSAPDNSGIAVVLRLSANQGLLQDLSRNERAGMSQLNSASKTHAIEQRNLETEQKLYQDGMGKLHAKLQKLEANLILIKTAAQKNLDNLLDESYIPEIENNEIRDAMMTEGGADLAQEIIMRMVKDTVGDKAKEFAKNLLSKIPGSHLFIELDPRKVQFALRKIIKQTTTDISLIQRYKNSQIYSPPMDQAMHDLHQRYPFLQIQQDSTLLQRAAAKFTNLIKKPTLGPTVSQSYKDQQQKVGVSIGNLGAAQANLRGQGKTAETILEETTADIKRLGCPYITGLNNLSRPNIERCADWALQKTPQDEKDPFPACYPWSAQGHLGCAQALHTGHKIPFDVQLGILVNKIRDGLKARKTLSTADTTVREANSRINQLDELAPQLNRIIVQLQSFQNTWIADRRVKLKELSDRHVIAQADYLDLSSKLLDLQEKWANFIIGLSQLEDQEQALKILLIANIASSVSSPKDANLARDVNKAQNLARNLAVGIDNLTRKMNEFDTDIKYLRDSKIIREKLDAIKDVLFSTQTRLNTLLSKADTGMTKIEGAIESMDCKWFRSIGAGQRGLNQCLAAFVSKVRQLGTVLNKPICNKVDLNSRYIENDLDACSIRPQSTAGINEGDVVKGGQIIKGMKADNTDAMIDKLMLEGGYSRDQARHILEEMMIL